MGQSDYDVGNAFSVIVGDIEGRRSSEPVDSRIPHECRAPVVRTGVTACTKVDNSGSRT